MRAAIVVAGFALAVGAHADAKRDFFRFVNKHGGGGWSSAAAGIVGGHHGHTVRIKPIAYGFESSFVDTSVDLVHKEYVKLTWLKIQDFVVKPDKYFDCFNLEIDNLYSIAHVIARSGSGRNVEKTDKLERRSIVKIAFRTKELAERAASLAKKAQYEEIERRFGPLYRVFYNGQPMKAPNGAPFRIVKGAAYARVCSFSEVGIKTYNNNYKFVIMTKDGVDWKWPVGEKVLQIGEERFATELAPMQLGDNLFYPVRDLLPRLGFAMSWDAKKRILHIARRTPLAPSTP